MFRAPLLVWSAALSAGLLAVLIAGVAGYWPLHGIDEAFDRLLAPMREGPLAPVMLVTTALGDGLFLTLAGVVTVIAFLFAGARYRASAYGMAFVAMPFVVQGIKWLTERARPRAIAYSGTDVFSFPSGHVANSALIYGAIAGLSLVTFKGVTGRLLAGAFILLPLMIGASRLYLGAHWLSDVLAGYALAGLFLVLLALAVKRHPEPPRFSRAVPIALFVIAAAFPAYLLITLPDASELYRAIELHEPVGRTLPPSPSPD
ncbi:MAG: phosphatase PAP2 family protein [Hyphomonas sp.]|uniref:phosphatase PAP2 family protein n=1 Tax=Hyphomonas sp. TaxID=87 RepID=UPI003526EE8E